MGRMSVRSDTQRNDGLTILPQTLVSILLRQEALLASARCWAGAQRTQFYQEVAVVPMPVTTNPDTDTNPQLYQQTLW